MAKKEPNKPQSVTGPIRESTSQFTGEWRRPPSADRKRSTWNSVHVIWKEHYRTNERSLSVYTHTLKNDYRAKQATNTQVWIDRDDYFPIGSKILESITLQIASVNEYGENYAREKSFNFKKPAKPKVDFEYDYTTGLLTITVNSPVTDKKDRYDCKYSLYRKDTGTNSSRYNGRELVALNSYGNPIEGTSKQEEFTLDTNVQVLQLLPGTSILFTLKVEARGLAGTTEVVRTYKIAPPPRAEITRIDLSNNDKVSLEKNTLTRGFVGGLVRVFYRKVHGKNVSAAYDKKAETDFTLQRLITSYSVNRPVEAGIQSGWEDVDTNMGSTSEARKKYTVTRGGYDYKVKVETGNNADAVMGEPTIDVLTDMGFNENARVYDKRVWYRIKSEKQGMVSYSVAFQAKDLAIPNPSLAKDYSGFMAIKNSLKEPGRAIEGVVGWDNADKTDEGIDNPNLKEGTWTTLVEWSEHNLALRSNEKPSALEIDWKYSNANHAKVLADYQNRVNSGLFGESGENYPIPWQKSAKFAIYGLTPGVPIYLWTRRHLTIDNYDLYGPYSKAPKGFFPFTPIDNPTMVGVYVDEYYIYDEPLTVSWSHNATCDQTAWNIYAIPAEPSYVAKKYKPGITNVSSIPKKLLASGTGKQNSYVIDPEILSGIQGKKACVYKDKKAFTILKQLGIVVGVSTGGKEILSIQDEKGKYIDANFMKIVHSPTASLYVPPQLKIQPGVVYLFTNSTNVRGVINIYARYETTLYLPDGEHIQPEDECVWSYNVSSFRKTVDALSDNEKRDSALAYYLVRFRYVAKVKVPANKELYDGSYYQVRAYTVSTINETLKSEEQIATFKCVYSHQAVEPGKKSRIETFMNSGYIKFATNAASSGFGIKDKAVTIPPGAIIYCSKPEVNYKTSDTCRLYRITPDGGVMIADNVPFESYVYDQFAPFSNTALTRYAIMTVTNDGDMSWREVNYSLKRHGMRFDWGSRDRPRSLELPFNLKLSDSFEKDVRIDMYKDGSVNAYFNDGVKRTASNSTELIRLENPMQFELVRELARYPGTVFFRAYDGTAYECVVEVDGLENSYDSQVSPVSFRMTEVDLSNRFKPDPDTDIIKL